MSADYEMTFTNNPQFKEDGSITEETFDLNEIALGVVDLRHYCNFGYNKRTATTDFATLISNTVSSSPTTAQAYFSLYVPNPVWPLHLVKREMVWLNRKNKGAKVTMTYNNHPKYFYDLDGYTYNLFEYKIEHTKPVDIVAEYKVINRPSKLTVVNYAYQTEKGQVLATINANIGRQPDEFVAATPFRRDLGGHLTRLYQFACKLFFSEFNNVVPVAFTYYMNDIKYSYSSDLGSLQLTVSFNYTLKKYVT